MVDQSKAFDRVEWEWLQLVMEKFGFGKRMIGWILSLYKHANSAIHTNGYTSEIFPLSRSLRQGSPLGALLYILQAEPFAETQRKNKNIHGIMAHGEEVKISSFADDTQLYISDEMSLKETWRVLKAYSLASGAQINKEKNKMHSAWKFEKQGLI